MARTITSVSQPAASALQTNKVLRNTYMLLGLTLAFSALTAFISMQFGAPRLNIFMTLGIFFALSFATSKFQDSALGLVFCFALTGFLGFMIAPMISMYLSIPNGAELVMLAFGGTAAIFFGLSAYALITRTNFGFMGGMLMTGIIVVFVAMIANIFFQIPALGLAISCIFMALSSGLILWQTSEIIHGGETNYISATVTIFVSLFNIFSSLLHILGWAGGDE